MKGLIFKSILLMGAFTSCQSCRSSWDCPIGRGVPCTPVTEIESMIVESDCGPNIFLGSESNRKPECNPKNRKSSAALSPKIHRVWMTKKIGASGESLQGFYLYLDQECD